MRAYGFEWKSSAKYGRYPFVHVAFGRDPDGKLRVAKGIIAIGQFGVGVITIAQVGAALLFGFGQVIIAPLVVAQIAIGLFFGLGQIATGYIAIGQVVLAYYGLAQMGVAKYLWTFDRKDAEAVQFFKQLLEQILRYIYPITKGFVLRRFKFFAVLLRFTTCLRFSSYSRRHFSSS